jgi:hypothetical protein
MVAAALAVSRMRPALTWRALDGDLVAGEVSARLRPDNRWFVYFDTWRADAYPRWPMLLLEISAVTCTSPWKMRSMTRWMLARGPASPCTGGKATTGSPPIPR